MLAYIIGFLSKYTLVLVLSKVYDAAIPETWMEDHLASTHSLMPLI